MAAQKPIRDLFISSDEEEKQTQVSQNVSQRLYEDDEDYEDQMFNLGSSVSNKISIENVSDSFELFEELETQSEDENYRNTISTSEISESPMTPSQESEPKN